jgi:hypothetical protein
MFKGKNLLYVALGAGAIYWYYTKMKKDKAAKALAAKSSKTTTSDNEYSNASGCPPGFTYSINSNKVAVCDNGKGWRYRTNKK